MPRAEVGTQKHLANKMRSKGLQRLRWFCQVCSKQCRDANGFKCHVQSESHVRQMQVVGENPKVFIEQFSKDFHHDFIQLLRTAHGEKWISLNQFYQSYIANKEHIHMNATKWPSLTEYAKYLGREGICQVKEDDKGALMVAWRDVSSEAVKRREAIRQAELDEAANENHEERRIKKMVERARAEAEAKEAAAKAKAAEAQASESKTSETTAAEPTTTGENGMGTDDTKPENEEPPKPVKLSFGLKSKTVPAGKAGLGVMRSQSVFKRARIEGGEEKTTKKMRI